MRRRIVVVLIALLAITALVFGAIWAFNGVKSMIAEATAPEEPKPTVQPTAAGPEGDAASGRCPAEDVQVKASVDKKVVPLDEQPEFTIEVVNGHGTDCIIDVGTAQQEFLVMQGEDTVWSSRYCADEAADEEAKANDLVFAAGGSKKASFQWNRIPVDDSCHRIGDAFEGGDYALVVKLGETASKPAPFTLEAPPEPEPTSTEPSDEG